MTTAIIDIGTNTVLLLIANKNADGSYEVLHDEAQIARLGEGIHNNPAFLDEAMQRAFKILSDYKKIIKPYNCEKVLAFGTAACRQASNAHSFVDKVSSELGIQIEIISGEKEAEIINKAATQDFPTIENKLVLDIGGGSTEFITDSQSVSLPFGSVKLTEKFLHSDPPTKSEIEKLKSYVLAEIKKLNLECKNLIATAGTPTTLSALSKNLQEYDSNIVHGSTLTLNEIMEVTNKLQSLPLKERSKLPCLPAKRADVIIAGSYILSVIVNHLNLESIYVSDHGLRYGALYS